MTSVSKATDDDIARFYGGISLAGEWIGLARRRGRLVVAMGGIVRTDSGPWRGFMDIPPSERGASVYRHASRLLKDAAKSGADQVAVACDDTIPRAVEFLERLGFQKTDEIENDMAVWVWRV